jgi:hypothetical protein
MSRYLNVASSSQRDIEEKIDSLLKIRSGVQLVPLAYFYLVDLDLPDVDVKNCTVLPLIDDKGFWQAEQKTALGERERWLELRPVNYSGVTTYDVWVDGKLTNTRIFHKCEEATIWNWVYLTNKAQLEVFKKAYVEIMNIYEALPPEIYASMQVVRRTMYK